ncbi:MAG: hypothetical protein R2819_13810 [Allomuricauda sp.]
MILLLVKVKSPLSEEELLERAKEREPLFKAFPGLLQKYYVKLGEPGHYGGVYVWDSMESLQAYKESDLAKSIPEAYEMTEAPKIEVMDIIFQLRD